MKKKLEPLLSEFYQNKINAAKGYYMSHINGKHMMVFDCGYSGSISRAMDSIYKGEKLFDKMYLYETSENRAIDQKLGSNKYLIFDGKPNEYYYVFERLFSSLEGTCIGFDSNNKPILSNRNRNCDEQRDNDVVNNAVEACVQSFFQLIRKYISFFGDIGNIKFIEKLLSIAFEYDTVVDLFSNYVFEESLTANTKSTLDNVIKGERNASRLASKGLKNIFKKVKTLFSYGCYYLKSVGFKETIVLTYHYVRKGL